MYKGITAVATMVIGAMTMSKRFERPPRTPNALVLVHRVCRCIPRADTKLNNPKRVLSGEPSDEKSGATVGGLWVGVAGGRRWRFPHPSVP